MKLTKVGGITSIPSVRLSLALYTFPARSVALIVAVVEVIEDRFIVAINEYVYLESYPMGTVLEAAFVNSKSEPSPPVKEMVGVSVMASTKSIVMVTVSLRIIMSSSAV